MPPPEQHGSVRLKRKTPDKASNKGNSRKKAKVDENNEKTRKGEKREEVIQNAIRTLELKCFSILEEHGRAWHRDMANIVTTVAARHEILKATTLKARWKRHLAEKPQVEKENVID